MRNPSSAPVSKSRVTRRFTACAALLTFPIALFAQSPAFEAASIRPRVGDVQNPSSSPTRFAHADATLAFLASFAYGVKEFQIIGGPSWIRSDGYEVLATTREAASDDLMRLMMQRLLADRFGLVVHRDTTTRDVYALRVRKDAAARMKRSSIDCVARRAAGAAPAPSGAVGAPCTWRMGISGAQATLVMDGAPLSQLADLLERFVNRRVIDETGLPGTYDLSLTFAADQVTWRLPAGANPNAISGDELSLDTALREQLGLQLVSTRGTVPSVVIDDAHRPDPN